MMQSTNKEKKGVVERKTAQELEIIGSPPSLESELHFIGLYQLDLMYAIGEIRRLRNMTNEGC